GPYSLRCERSASFSVTALPHPLLLHPDFSSEPRRAGQFQLSSFYLTDKEPEGTASHKHNWADRPKAEIAGLQQRLCRTQPGCRLSLPEQGTDDNSAFPVIAEAVSLRAVNSGGRGKSLVLKGPALPPTPWMLTGD
ncbi:unnamed protein product, partial [Rangifer tarandus platyrhynchus]